MYAGGNYEICNKMLNIALIRKEVAVELML